MNYKKTNKIYLQYHILNNSRDITIIFLSYIHPNISLEIELCKYIDLYLIYTPVELKEIKNITKQTPPEDDREGGKAEKC